eukprot:12911084-Prorocentrum_lima.AAC.1
MAKSLLHPVAGELALILEGPAILHNNPPLHSVLGDLKWKGSNYHLANRTEELNERQEMQGRPL